jgi:hypothetical protein
VGESVRGPAPEKFTAAAPLVFFVMPALVAGIHVFHPVA